MKRKPLYLSQQTTKQKFTTMKTKTFNGVKIKNTEFSRGEKLFDMDLKTATKYKELVKIDYNNYLLSAWEDRRYANMLRSTIKNINLYITAIS